MRMGLDGQAERHHKRYDANGQYRVRPGGMEPDSGKDEEFSRQSEQHVAPPAAPQARTGRLQCTLATDRRPTTEGRCR